MGFSSGDVITPPAPPEKKGLSDVVQQAKDLLDSIYPLVIGGVAFFCLIALVSSLKKPIRRRSSR